MRRVSHFDVNFERALIIKIQIIKRSLVNNKNSNYQKNVSGSKFADEKLRLKRETY